MPLLLGVDIGTTAVKVAAYQIDGIRRGLATREYPLITPTPGHVEVECSTYWAAFADALHSLLADLARDQSSIIAMALSCQGETLVTIGGDGRPSGAAIVWLDDRASAEAAELEERFGSGPIYEVTGQPRMLPTWPAAKVLWLARHQPARSQNTRWFMLLEDWFLFRLTGEVVCEGSLVTSTCFWNFRTKVWWGEMLAAIGTDAAHLPNLVEPGTPIGRLTKPVAGELGLPDSTLVCAGALDQACGAVGVGNTQPGVLSENTGAAVALCATLDAPTLDPEARMPCHYHAIPDMYMFHTFTSGGIVLQWLRDSLAESEVAVGRNTGTSAYELLDRQAARVSAGSDGLIVLPHLQGAMAPDLNPLARGAIIGLDLHHGKPHLVRAILEAVAFVIRHNIEVLEDLDVSVRSIRALGGGARSAVWKQTEADVTRRPVATTTQSDAATLGAAILAGIAAGYYANAMEAASQMVQICRTFEPDPRNFDVYDEAYSTYRQVYDALCPVFPRMENLRGSR